MTSSTDAYINVDVENLESVSPALNKFFFECGKNIVKVNN